MRKTFCYFTPSSPIQFGKVFPTRSDVFAKTVPFKRKTKSSDFNPSTMIKMITWNVASLRAIERNGTFLPDLVLKEKPHVLCLQETKLSSETLNNHIGVLAGYTFVDSFSTARKGYSGTRTYIRNDFAATHNVKHRFGFLHEGTHEAEGRLITTTFSRKEGTLSKLLPRRKPLTVVNTYVANAGQGLKRINYRVNTFDKNMAKHLSKITSRPASYGNLVWAGDFNCADKDYDRFWSTGGYKQMITVAGFSYEERTSYRQILKDVPVRDAFRHLYPHAAHTYTFWHYKMEAREKNLGWRIDGFNVSPDLLPHLADVFPLSDFKGSDHCPVVMWLR